MLRSYMNLLRNINKMPLTTTGKKLEKKFEKEYGKEKGKRIFHSWEHSHPFVKKK